MVAVLCFVLFRFCFGKAQPACLELIWNFHLIEITDCVDEMWFVIYKYLAIICYDSLPVSSEERVIKWLLTQQGCHLPRWYGTRTDCDLAELVLCSHQCLKLALTAGWLLAHDGEGYQEGRGWRDSILTRLQHNCLSVKPVESTCHCH